MKRIAFVLLLIGSLTGFAAAQCYSSDASKCCNVTALAQCPAEGCGGDANLNRRKNVTEIPADAGDITFNEMLYLRFPASWPRGAERSLLATWGEGRAVRMKARIIKAKASGHETKNCHLKTQRNLDYHLVLTRIKGATEQHSVTGEMTPRLRPGGWTLAKLRRLSEDEAYARVTGYLMLDTEHLNDSEPKRYTDWEIHPITRFEVCTLTRTKCDAGEGWHDLEDWEEQP